MTGFEALSLLKTGKTLRRQSWKPNQKCKVTDYFGEWMVHVVRENFDDISDEELKYILDDGFNIVDSNFEDMLGLFDAINAGEFLHDDWEVVDEIL